MGLQTHRNHQRLGNHVPLNSAAPARSDWDSKTLRLSLGLLLASGSAELSRVQGADTSGATPENAVRNNQQAKQSGQTEFTLASFKKDLDPTLPVDALTVKLGVLETLCQAPGSIGAQAKDLAPEIKALIFHADGKLRGNAAKTLVAAMGPEQAAKYFSTIVLKQLKLSDGSSAPTPETARQACAYGLGFTPGFEQKALVVALGDNNKFLALDATIAIERRLAAGETIGADTRTALIAFATKTAQSNPGMSARAKQVVAKIGNPSLDTVTK